jgi:hypothetical protein
MLAVMVPRLFVVGLIFAVCGAPIAAEICTALCGTLVGGAGAAPDASLRVTAGAHQHDSVERSDQVLHHHQSASAVGDSSTRVSAQPSAVACAHADGVATESREVARGADANVTIRALDPTRLRPLVASTKHIPIHGPPRFLHRLSPLRI